MIKVIVFDLWNTLIPTTIDWPHLLSLIKKNNSGSVKEDLSLGEFIRAYEELTQVKKYLNYEEFRKDFLSNFSGDGLILESKLYEIFVNRLDKIHFFDDVVSTLIKLKKEGYKLALLTNTENLAFDKVDSVLNISKYFDFLGLSFEIGNVKPSPKMFESVVNHFGVSPFDCLMVGDSLRSDITGAMNFGMHAAWINRPDKSFDLAKIVPEFELNTLKDIDNVLGVLNGK